MTWYALPRFAEVRTVWRDRSCRNQSNSMDRQGADSASRRFAKRQTRAVITWYRSLRYIFIFGFCLRSASSAQEIQASAISISTARSFSDARPAKRRHSAAKSRYFFALSSLAFSISSSAWLLFPMFQFETAGTEAKFLFKFMRLRE